HEPARMTDQIRRRKSRWLNPELTLLLRIAGRGTVPTVASRPIAASAASAASSAERTKYIANAPFQRGTDCPRRKPQPKSTRRAIKFRQQQEPPRPSPDSGP